MIGLYFFLFFISLVLALLVGLPLISIFKKLGAKQHIREEGPPGHKIQKKDIPTFGGAIFLLPVSILIPITCIINKEFQSLDIFAVLLITLISSSTGFIDDLLKIRKRRNKGISGWSKIFIQITLAVFLFLIYKENAPLVFLIWYFFVISGASNAFNLTDGLDGLAASISFASLLGIACQLHLLNKPELSIFCVILMGGILGFLYYNKYPAKIFMGDTGSLAIGGAVGSLAIASGHEIYLIFFAFIPIVETLSVILQVISCQFSKKFLGKDIRIFKMTPLHHHFELIGYSETKIVKSFFLVQIFFVIVGVTIFTLSQQ